MKNWLSASLTLVLGLGIGSTAVIAQAPESPRPNVLEMARPIEALDNVWIEELTALEVRDALREGRTTALILTGGIEQNGPYLTNGKHNHVLRVVGESIARRLGNALVAPILTLKPGNPEEIPAPGTVMLSAATYSGVLRDMATSLKSQGFRDVFILGDSRSNQILMAQVAEELGANWRGGSATIHFIPEFYNYDDVKTFLTEVLGIVEQSEGLHDDYAITSIIVNDDPQHVRFEQRLKAGKASINGVSLVPLERTLWHGRQIVEFRTDATVDAIRKALTSAGRD